eukprot:19209-Eustigmatos_ZCMA.PRE.1
MSGRDARLTASAGRQVTAKTSDARFKIQKMGIFKVFRGGAIPKLRAEVAHKAQGAITHGV